MLLTGVKHKYSSLYHPQSNGASERTNKTVNQCIRFHVERNQTGWAKSLPLIRFQIMNSVNKSTGFSPFQLRFGRTARVLPPLIVPPPKLLLSIPQLAKLFKKYPPTSRPPVTTSYSQKYHRLSKPTPPALIPHLTRLATRSCSVL
jgi:hypothetical protein